ncbi:MAG: SGNH/GDSL hydrolase family protein [Pirellulaceae bacterium]|nr:SGNH/GDSL hydrolase family protein [Pirellulaceae bacterium]
MPYMFRFCLVSATAGVALLIAAASVGLAAEAKPVESDDAWVAPMTAVHQKFKGRRGTFAQFGDSITVSRAFWFGLRYAPKNTSPQMAGALRLMKDYMLEDCWDWKGPEFGSQGRMTIRWAHQNVGKWLDDLNPEVALIMFGTNDLGSLDLAEYETKTRQVVQKCLDNGTIVILSTIPPKHGQAEKAAAFADAVRRIAREMQLPLTDYHAEILKRRPDDWDGASDQFRQYEGYDVPTLIARDGVHPSNPQKYANDYSDVALHENGFSLRNHLTLMKYAEVIEKVLSKNSVLKDAP